MRKLHVLMLIVLVFLLVACKPTPEGPIDLTVHIAEESFEDGEIDVHVVVGTQAATPDDLLEIVYEVARVTYEKHLTAIGTDAYVLTIYVYVTTSDYQADSATLGTISFSINESVSRPGLSLLEDNLIDPT